MKNKDLTKKQLQEILANDDLNLFDDGLNQKERDFAYSFAKAIIEWCEKNPQNKELLHIQ